MNADGLSPLKQAFLALQDAQERVAELEAEKNEPIAIIGAGCRVPGPTGTSPEGFWRMLAEGHDAVSAALPQRWRDTGAQAHEIAEHARYAGLLALPDQFDAEFFGISPREAVGMDPQQRLMLEVSWEALEHSGIAPTSLYGSATGVFVGICASDYSLLRLALAPSGIDAHFGSGTAHSIAAGRVSYLLGLRGPSLSIDTACSSSLVAVHLACDALRRGDCSLALAGGVNLILSSEATRTFSQAGMLASRSKPFSASADGFVRGEGCGVVVLKRLREAVASEDRVLAVILGSAVNHDGPSSGLTVPNGQAQQALIRRALDAAGVAPAAVGYVEAHGTGTSLGDPIEAEALGTVMAAGRPVDRPLLIGSVKSNLGHLEAAAGVAGLIKLVLALGHRELPGQLHCETPSPHIRWEPLKLRVADRMQPWEPIDGRRIAGVSSFGFSGTNAHVVISEAPPVVEADADAVERPFEILPVAARSEGSLRVLAERYVERLSVPAEEWRDLCHTASVGRVAFAHRLSVRGSDAASLRSGLTAFLAGQPAPGVVAASGRLGKPPRIGLLFTGQGSQYAGMGRALYAHSPGFRRLADRADAVLADRLEVPLGAVMRGEHAEAAGLLNQTLYTQPALYVLEYAVASLWRALGVQPVAVLGHSLGEYAGCAFAGVFGFEEGLRLVADRARLMHGLASDGAMIVVAASEADVAPLLAGREAAVSLAGVNAARQVTVSGERGAVAAIAEACGARGWRSQALTVSQAFHSPLMEPIGAALEARGNEVSHAAPRVPVISNVTGAPLERVDGSYWRSHMRSPVRFGAGLETLWGLGCDTLIEVGPRPVLIQLARQAGGNQTGSNQTGRRYLTSLKGAGTDEWDTLCQAVQELYAAGAALDWSGWNRDYPRRKVDAPLSVFERRRYWITPSVSEPARPRGLHPLLGSRLRSALAGGQFDAEIDAAGETAWLGDHRIGEQAILPATGLIEMMLAAGQAVVPGWRALAGLSIVAPVVLAAAGTRAVQTVVDQAGDGTLQVRVFAAEADRFRLCAEARLEQAGAEQPAAVDVAALRGRCPRLVTGEAHYRHLAARGALFGAAFQGVRQIWAGDGEALGEVAVLLPPLAGNRPHPAVLDGCLQVGAAAVAESGDMFMPVALDRFICRDVAWPAQVLVHAVRCNADPLRPAFDFTVLDADGNPLAQFRNLAFRRAHGANAGDDIGGWFHELTWRAWPIAEASDDALAEWFVAGSGNLASAIVAELNARRRQATAFAAPDAALEAALADRRGRGIVFVPPDLDDDAPDNGPMSARSGLEQLLALSHCHAERGLLVGCRLYVVTRKVHAVLPDEGTMLTDAAISGLAASLFNEFPELKCTRIDVDPGDAVRAGKGVTQELLANAADDWTAYRDGHRFVARLQAAACMDIGEQEPVRLVSDHGMNGLEWRAMQRRALGPDEIEIEVRAAPLNFRDVVSVVGLIAVQAELGSECAGVVSRVGHAVKRFRPGDDVVAVTPGSFASFAVASEVRTIAKPASLPFETAAAQSLVYLTADHCLNDIARMRAGERVLIHAATGGVGLAALQLCRQAGVEIYATAGSEAKRQYLRELGIEHVFSSRDVEFAAAIRNVTDGQGVDIVLNSLAGPFVDAGLSVLRPGGRFVEIGKTDIRDKAAIELAHPDIRYDAIDLTTRLHAQPEQTMARMGELFAAMVQGELQPVPHRSYGFADASLAFRELAAARHIGKLVLISAEARPAVQSDGAYIVTGGAASVGFAVAEWLAEQGAGKVILLNRRAPTPDVAARIARWRDKGVDMVARQGDVRSWSTVTSIVAEVAGSLRGVIHCANVLDDAPIGELDWQRFEQVMLPKAQGAWHLHRATRGCPLDFFVLFSSWAAIAGKRGGANYAAASVALDSLAHLRRREGLPALSIDWGAWTDIGWAARLADDMPARPGFGAMKPDKALAAMAIAMRRAGSAQVAIAPIDWARLMPTLGRHPASVFSGLAGPQRIVDGAASTKALPSLAEITACSPPDAVHLAVVSHLQAIAAAALFIDEPSQIDPDQPLQEMGLDSIMAVDLRNTLAHSLDAALPATLLFDHPTLNSLARFSIALVSPQQRSPMPVQAPASGEDDLLSLIEGLSDAEVEARWSHRTTEVAL